MTTEHWMTLDPYHLDALVWLSGSQVLLPPAPRTEPAVVESMNIISVSILQVLEYLENNLED